MLTIEKLTAIQGLAIEQFEEASNTIKSCASYGTGEEKELRKLRVLQAGQLIIDCEALLETRKTKPEEPSV